MQLEEEVIAGVLDEGLLTFPKEYQLSLPKTWLPLYASVLIAIATGAKSKKKTSITGHFSPDVCSPPVHTQLTHSLTLGLVTCALVTLSSCQTF